MIYDINEDYFKNHVATFTDYGNIKILDFKRPDTNHYRIRFLFDEDHYRLYISGDLGELVAYNPNNMTYDDFEDFVHSPSYFESKILCHSRNIYEYDYDRTRQAVEERLLDVDFIPHYDFETEEDLREEAVDSIMSDYRNDKMGLGTAAYDELLHYDPDGFEYFETLGRQWTGILNLYLLAFELAHKQIEEKNNGIQSN